MNFDMISMKKRAKEIFKSNASLMIMMTIVLLVTLYVRTIVFRQKSWQIALGLYVLAVLIMGMLKIGYYTCILNISRGKESEFPVLFNGFKKNAGRNLISILIYCAGIYLAISFLIVPGVILFYRWRFVYFVLSDGEHNVLNAFKRSMELTKGHCLELFKIDVSFLGLYVLELITLELAGIYVIPITMITYAEYYDYIKGQYELVG